MKLTKTEEERKKCFDYLSAKGTHPFAPNYVYTERDGNITACAGIVFVGFIEPFASDNKIDGLELFGFAQGMIASKVEYAVAMTNKDNVKSILTKSDFAKWSLDNSEIYIKEL